MTRTRRIALAALVSLAGLVAVPSIAAAHPVFRLSTRTAEQTSSAYSASTELRMRAARDRIGRAAVAVRMSESRRQQLLRDVDVGVGLIRQRVAMYGQDGKISLWEDEQVRSLARAIAADLTKTYGSIDSFMLL